MTPDITPDHKSAAAGKRCLTRKQIAFMLLLGSGLLAFWIAAFFWIKHMKDQMTASGNVRLIIAGLKTWAGEHDGKYPDADASKPRTANAAFRLLIISEVGFADSNQNELLFGCPGSPFVPDDLIGTSPDYKRALEPGENHWALTKAQTDASPWNIPLVFENPINSNWPPTWNADLAGKKHKGRAWKDGKILVGLNDGSVEFVRLAATSGASVPTANDREYGENIFTRALEHAEFLDVEESDSHRLESLLHEPINR